MLQSSSTFVTVGLAENVKVFVSYLEEGIVVTGPLFQSTRNSMLNLNYVLLQNEPGLQKLVENAYVNRNVMLLSSRVANQDGAVFVGLQNSEAFSRRFSRF